MKLVRTFSHISNRIPQFSKETVWQTGPRGFDEKNGICSWTSLQWNLLWQWSGLAIRSLAKQPRGRVDVRPDLRGAIGGQYVWENISLQVFDELDGIGKLLMTVFRFSLILGPVQQKIVNVWILLRDHLLVRSDNWLFETRRLTTKAALQSSSK